MLKSNCYGYDILNRGAVLDTSNSSVKEVKDNNKSKSKAKLSTMMLPDKDTKIMHNYKILHNYKIIERLCHVIILESIL